VLVHLVLEKTNLFSVPPAPFANQQVQPKPESFGAGKLMVECLGLEPGNIAAGG
jgi:hypothetical protein